MKRHVKIMIILNWKYQKKCNAILNMETAEMEKMSRNILKIKAYTSK